MQIPITGKISKQIEVYSYNGILLNNWKEQITDESKNVDEF